MERLNKGIFASLDWCDVVFSDMTFDEVLSSMSFDNSFSPDFVEMFLHCHPVSRGYFDDLFFNFYGGTIQLRGKEVYDRFSIHSKDINLINVDQFFATRFDYIKVSFGGSALLELRSLGFDVDSWIFQPFVLPLDHGEYHFTRLDFAYDLINYKPDFLRKVAASCKKYQDPNTLKLCVGRQSGITWEYHSGRKDCLYLGKGGSEISLRIYDKFLQLNSLTGNGLLNTRYSYGHVVPVQDLRSWIRIELQVRRQFKCADCVYSSNSSFESIFKFIYDKFAVREGSSSDLHGLAPVCSEWQNLFDFNKIGSLMQNSYFVQSDPITPIEKAANWIETACMGNLILYVSKYGFDHLKRVICDRFSELQLSDSPFVMARCNKLIQKMISLDGSLAPNLFCSPEKFLSFKDCSDLELVQDKTYRYLQARLKESDLETVALTIYCLDYFSNHPYVDEIPSFGGGFDE